MNLNKEVSRMMIELNVKEVELIGQWNRVSGKVQVDATSERIEKLISSSLTKMAERDDGWTVLFQDPADSRYWELTYPNSDWHGGGPPALKCITEDVAREKYDLSGRL